MGSRPNSRPTAARAVSGDTPGCFWLLVRETGFNRWSDVDIAAWGIAPEDTFRAIGAVMDLDTEVRVNLVDVNTACDSLLAEIERHGIEL